MASNGDSDYNAQFSIARVHLLGLAVTLLAQSYRFKQKIKHYEHCMSPINMHGQADYQERAF